MLQFDCLEPSAPEPIDLPLAVIAARPTLKSAILLSAEVSGLSDKQIYGPLDISPAHWSRIKTGSMHFPENKLDHFMDVVGNEIPLIWQATRRNKQLVPMRSTVEQERDEARAEVADLRRKLETITQFVKETRSVSG
ncbi:MAG: hypothetical protein AAFX44_06535 [Pseudomonadota bacterium]